MNEIKLYNIDEVAQILGVSKRTVYRYIKLDQLKATRLGRSYKVSEEALRRFIEKGTEPNYLKKL